MTKLVIFDWGGVIENHTDPDYGWNALTKNIIKRLSDNRSTELKVWSTFEKDGETVPICSVNNKEDFYKWIDYVALKNGFDNDKAKFFKVYHEEYKKIYYYKGVVNYIHSLRGKCLVGILSNLLMVDKERLDEQVDFKYIDKLFLSFELGMVKPNLEIYKKVEELSGINASDILFIDDRIENIRAAALCGWHVLQATGEDLELIKNTVNDFIEK